MLMEINLYLVARYIYSHPIQLLFLSRRMNNILIKGVNEPTWDDENWDIIIHHCLIAPSVTKKKADERNFVIES